MRCLIAMLAAAAAFHAVPAAAVAGASEPAQAAASFGVQLSGTVSTNCRVQIGNAMVAADGTTVDLGGMNEFCNSAAGYDVFVDYAPQLAGATLLVDGLPVTLGGQGSLKVASEAGPAVKARALQLATATAMVDGALSFRIVPR